MGDSREEGDPNCAGSMLVGLNGARVWERSCQTQYCLSRNVKRHWTACGDGATDVNVMVSLGLMVTLVSDAVALCTGIPIESVQSNR